MVWFKEIVFFYLALFSVSCAHWYSAIIDNFQDSQVEISKGINNDIPDYFGRKIESTDIKNISDVRKHDERSTVFTTKEIIQTRPDNTVIRNRYVMGDVGNTSIQLHKSLEKEYEEAEEIKRTNNRLTENRRILLNKKYQSHSNGTTKSRLFEVFQVVRFDHERCTSNGLDGICVPENKCITDGGSVMGTCADGYGVCCINLFTCDNSTSVTTSWFTNPTFPSPNFGKLSCTFTIHKASNEIKQIRLDFLVFEMLPPTAGFCQDDQFITSGQNLNSIVPILCGINSGQHVYLEVSDVDGPIHFSVQSVSAEARIFSIKVSQLTPADDLAAPTGCLQYYTDSEGVLESFNYRDTSEIASVNLPSYTKNLNYAICIQRAAESCSVTYTTAGGMQIVNYDTDGLPIIPPNQAGVEIYNCPSDYLLIAATRLCGERLNDGSILQDFSLNAPIIDNSAGPIVVWFRSDEGYVGRGFKLNYQQISCSIPDHK